MSPQGSAVSDELSCVKQKPVTEFFEPSVEIFFFLNVL